MSMTWLYLGLAIGLLEGLNQGGVLPMISMMIGAMMVLPIVGLALALIGGDVRGSVAGAALGLLGSLGIELSGAVLLQPQARGAIIIFCALAGATCLLFTRFLIWRYTMIWRVVCWLMGVPSASGQAWASFGPFHRASRHAGPRVGMGEGRSCLAADDVGSVVI
jgi:hypothetical protein